MALAVMIGMIVMGVLGTWQIEQSVKTIKAASTALSVNNFILRHVQELASNEQISPESIASLTAAIERSGFGAEMTSISIWGDWAYRLWQ